MVEEEERKREGFDGVVGGNKCRDVRERAPIAFIICHGS